MKCDNASGSNGSQNNAGESDARQSQLRQSKARKNWWPVGAALLLTAGGCQSEQLNQMLNVPTPPPAPTPVPKPKADFFDPTDYIGFVAADGTTKMDGVKLPPGEHRVAGVASPEFLTVQSVSADKKGRPIFGATAESVHLAGIISQSPGKPGWQSAVKAVLNWTALNPKKKTVEVQIDPRFPYDLSGRHMVQIYFNGTTDKTAGTRYSLNRMLVRSGWAVVDLHSATAIDLQAWLNDERYAHDKKLGLWGLGVALQQRDAVPLPKNARREKGRSNIRIESARPGNTGTPRSSAALKGTAKGTASRAASPATTRTQVTKTTTTKTTSKTTTGPAAAGAPR
jgi:hypothetical protein